MVWQELSQVNVNIGRKGVGIFYPSPLVSEENHTCRIIGMVQSEWSPLSASTLSPQVSNSSRLLRAKKLNLSKAVDIRERTTCYGTATEN